jgi:methionine-rich copper-binding protein CopC
MTHDEIAERNIAERYLMGKLSTDETARFEEHFVDCPACLDSLEATERFRTALKPVAGESAGPAILPAGPKAWPRSAWLVAAAMVLAAGVSLVLVMRDVTMRRELEQTRIASLDWQHSYERERSAAEALQRPTPEFGSTFYLNTTRGRDSDTSDPVNRVTLPSEPHRVVLSLEGELDAGFQSLRASLKDSAGRDVWQQSGIRATPHETLSLILPSGILHSGDYVLTLEGASSDGRYLPAGRYRFRVATR